MQECLGTSARSCVILVLDDEFFVARSLSMILQRMGHQVVGPASEVRQARALLDAFEVEFALLDVHLGDSTSFGLARELHERGIRFAFFTGYDDPEIIPPDLRHVRRLNKPLDDEALHHLLTHEEDC